MEEDDDAMVEEGEDSNDHDLNATDIESGDDSDDNRTLSSINETISIKTRSVNAIHPSFATRER